MARLMERWHPAAAGRGICRLPALAEDGNDATRQSPPAPQLPPTAPQWPATRRAAAAGKRAQRAPTARRKASRCIICFEARRGSAAGSGSDYVPESAREWIEWITVAQLLAKFGVHYVRPENSMRFTFQSD